LHQRCVLEATALRFVRDPAPEAEPGVKQRHIHEARLSQHVLFFLGGKDGEPGGDRFPRLLQLGRVGIGRRGVADMACDPLRLLRFGLREADVGKQEGGAGLQAAMDVCASVARRCSRGMKWKVSRAVAPS
jgi:hypothetical protein